MKASRRASLPVAPLLRAYASSDLASVARLSQLPGLGQRFQAISAAAAHWLSLAFLDEASESAFTAELVRFYSACVPHALHTETLRRRSCLVRHALAHLLHRRESLARKVERYLDSDGPYH
ncbi:MAG TPA: hypothetical protein VFA18_00670, partial [Gemmataceae bacterium]|nr:hypothetical protein [Gemmataceae bacterium]